jgi:hypothetical protein
MRSTTFLNFFLLALLSVLSLSVAAPLSAGGLAARDCDSVEDDGTGGGCTNPTKGVPSGPKKPSVYEAP